MLTLTEMIANLERSSRERREPRYHYRITWVGGVAHVQRCPVEVGTYAQDGEIVRQATPDDLAAMYAGRISCDSETDPSITAWRKHVDEGGD